MPNSEIEIYNINERLHWNKEGIRALKIDGSIFTLFGALLTAFSAAVVSNEVFPDYKSLGILAVLTVAVGPASICGGVDCFKKVEILKEERAGLKHQRNILKNDRFQRMR